MILHTLNRSSFTFDAGNTIAAIAAGDVLLLIEDGVYTALDEATLTLLRATGARINILEPDASARGITARVPDSIAPVSYDGFVTLVCTTDKTVAWF